MFTPNFDNTINSLWAKAATKKGNTRRCHYMPQFLMRRWAESDRLRVEDMATGVVTIYPTKEIRNGKKKNAFIDIGVVNDLYTTFEGNNSDRSTLEALFGQLESMAAKTIDGLAKKNWLLSAADRAKLAIFVAASVMRLPSVLRAVEREFQPDFERAIPGAKQHTGNTTHALLKSKLKAMTESFYAKHRWTIVRYPNARQHTGDIPLVIATHDNVPVSNNCDLWEIHMPLDPHALLVTNGEAGTNRPLRSNTLLGSAPNEWNASGVKRIL